jgi:cbb3-type cytochrome oxidase subunit 3
VVYEKTEMVPPSDFPSKTNVQPRHLTGRCWHTCATHVPVAHLSDDVATIFFLMISLYNNIYIYRKSHKAQKANMYLTRPDTIYVHLSKVQNIRNLDI